MRGPSRSPGADQQSAEMGGVVDVAQLVLVLEGAVVEPCARPAAAGAVRHELAARALLDLVGLDPQAALLDAPEDRREVLLEDVADEQLRPLAEVTGIDVAVPVDVQERSAHAAD